jgi:hypothetical protein
MNKLLLLCALAACGAGSDFGSGGDAGINTDGAGTQDAPGCSVVLSFDPQQPVADPVAPVRAHAMVFGASGVTMFTWTVLDPNSQPVTTTNQSTDGSMVDFVAATAGSYMVRAQVSAGTFCPDGFAVLPVSPTGAHTADYRVRVTPPSGAGAPPQETVIQVTGGADVTRDFALDPGLAVSGSVKNGATGVAAYLRFMPVSSPSGFVEVFSASGGSFSTRLLGQNHQVLVVPMVAGLAPALVTWTVTTTTLNVSAGNAITGTVKDGSGAALAGAQVQFTSGGVPSTLATTAADGSFTVRTSLATTATFDVTVSPPAGKGLPALSATGAFGNSVAIQYANVAPCSLAATTAPSNANVIVVGSVANAGTIGGAAALGTVKIAATADGTGKLPAVLVPRAPLSAVVDLSSASALDTSTCPAQTIAAPAPTTVSGTIVDGNGAPLVGGMVEATPVADLALAGVPQIVRFSGANGAYTLPLATGGHYDVTFSDPHAHSAPLPLANVTAAGVPTTALLGKALKLSGNVSVIASPNPVINASIQVFSLNAAPSVPPLGETASTQTSTYAVGIPDPGTM